MNSQVDEEQPMIKRVETGVKKKVDDEMALYKDKNEDANSDPDSEQSSDDENQRANEYTFESAIDVGSHFIDVTPEDQLLFSQHAEGHLYTKFKIMNPVKHCPIAFFVYTSAPIPVQIHPNMGFITPQEKERVISIAWTAQFKPDGERLENAMFFVKAIPLKPDTDLHQMSLNMQSVFNTYNVAILFTTHHLPCKVVVQQFNPQQAQQMAMASQQYQQQMQAQTAGQAQMQQMTPEQWQAMTPEQQAAYRQQVAAYQQQMAAASQQQQQNQ